LLVYLIKSLAVSGPFTMGAFQARLEQAAAREVRLQAVCLPAAAGSGIRLSSEGADYIHYQEQVSPFHQAHIVVGLAARMLLAGPGPVIDARLTRGLEPQLVRHILGNGTSVENDDAEAEICAYLVLEGLRPAVSRADALRLLADLEPLQHVLASALSGRGSGRGADDWVAAELRLYRVVTGILDLLLVSEPPELRPDGETFADEAVRLAGMSGELSQFVLRHDTPPAGSLTDPGDDTPFAGT
jgi:hypothetical protein